MPFFRTYDNFLGFYFGNEFLLQLFFVGLFLLPWQKRRRFFLLRALSASAIYFAYGICIATPLPWHYLAVFVLYFSGVFFCFDCKCADALFYAGNIYCIQFIISGVSYGFVYFLLYFGVDFSWYFLPATLFSVFISVCAWYYYGRRICREEHVQINSYLVFGAVIFFLIVSVIFTHYIPLAIPYDELGAQTYVKLFGAVFGAAILTVNLMNNKNTELAKDKQILQLLLQKDKEEYERARLNEEQLNIKYHDMKKTARLGVIGTEGLEEVDSVHLYYTGNRPLDIVLAAESRVCGTNRIHFICTADGELLNAIHMHASHIYSLLSNLLDNAIESLVEVEDISRREIRAVIQRHGSMCLIRVSNYTKKPPIIKGDLPQTTKRDKENHGFGSKSIRHIAEIYGGTAHFSVEDNIFTALVMLPIPEEVGVELA